MSDTATKAGRNTRMSSGRDSSPEIRGAFELAGAKTQILIQICECI